MNDEQAAQEFANNERDRASRLVPLVYEELRALARRYLVDEHGYRTLQPTALVHEAYLRLAKLEQIEWRDRNHFFAFAATQMRRILVEKARKKGRLKRGGEFNRVTFTEESAIDDSRSIDLLTLDSELKELDRRHHRQAQVAEMRLFSGMTFPEISGVLEHSERTIKSDWKVARAWLAMRLRSEK